MKKKHPLRKLGSDAEIAKIAGVTRQTAFNWVTGYAHKMSARHLEYLAASLDTCSSKLIKDILQHEIDKGGF